MACTNLTVTSGTGSTEYKLVIDVEPLWGSVADAAAKLADWFAGFSIFGYQLDQSLLGGWDVTRVEYASNRIEISLKKVGSLPILAVVQALWPYIVWILTALGIVALGWKLLDLSNKVIDYFDNSANRDENAKRAACISDQLNAGKTIDEALKICNVSYPGKGTDWSGLILPAVGLLAVAYVAGEFAKGR